MVKVSIHDAEAQLARLIERALAGEEIVIAQGTTPVVRLVPVASHESNRRPGSMKGRFEVPPSFFEPLPEEELLAWER